jgi:hypothetical protein
MNLAALFALLPTLVQTGFDVYQLVAHSAANANPTTPAEQFLNGVLQQLPALISAGVDIKAAVTNASAAAATMTAENRAPTDAEKAATQAELDALDTQFQKDAADPTAAPGV